MVELGGLAPGGLNFDCKVRRESTALEDMFIAHIGEPSAHCNNRFRCDVMEESVHAILM